MEQSISAMADSICAEWAGLDRSCVIFYYVGDIRRIHGFPFLDYYPRRDRVVARLNRKRSGVAEWDCLRRITAVDVGYIDRYPAADFARTLEMERAANRDGR